MQMMHGLLFICVKTDWEDHGKVFNHDFDLIGQRSPQWLIFLL